MLDHDDLHEIEYSKLEHGPQEESSFTEGTVGCHSIDSVLQMAKFFGTVLKIILLCIHNYREMSESKHFDGKQL